MHIVSYGGAGTAVMVLHAIMGQRSDVELVAIVDDFDNGHAHRHLGVPVIDAEQRRRSYASVPVSMQIAAPSAREALMLRLDQEGATHFTSAGDPRNVWHDLRIGDGSLIEPRTRVGPDVVMGRGVYCLAVLVAHDVTIGDYTTLGIGSSVLGHVDIGSGVTIGPGAIVRNGELGRRVTIGDGAVVGTGAVVTGHVPAGAVVTGNPALPLRSWAALRRIATKTRA